MKESEISIKVQLDENHVPENMQWNASDAGEGGKCNATMIALWDDTEKNLLRIDLWTKEMMVEDMKKFFYQNILTMADTFERATGEADMAKDMRDFGTFFGEEMGVILPA